MTRSYLINYANDNIIAVSKAQHMTVIGQIAILEASPVNGTTSSSSLRLSVRSESRISSGEREDDVPFAATSTPPDGRAEYVVPEIAAAEPPAEIVATPPTM